MLGLDGEKQRSHTKQGDRILRQSSSFSKECRLRARRKVGRDWSGPSPENQLFVFQWVVPAVCSHLYSDWVWIMLSVLYNLEYCMQNGPYWLCRSAEYKKGSAPAYMDNPLRKQSPARSSNEYKTPHKSPALAWHPALVFSSPRQW